ncbi:MauE/DoxX family redox-associated membrane protein [Kutzneria sp. 744]|uniref:DoxX family protein n=1 Tax=Kutzneria sp. (strain 744) TaxID=345341 RepID=UPI0003EEE169|nr:MauE/DoxX family redox-associated membrane protein [Kutzneria sp. 744]EWM13872.1 membrane protein [Kutzneria sp. 744]
MTSPRPALALSALLAVAGVSHFAHPKPYDRIVPTVLPGRARTWTHISGVAELAVAAAIVTPRTRRLGGLAAAVLFAAVFPANVKMALDARGRSRGERLATLTRLPLQVPLVIWALRVSRSAP